MVAQELINAWGRKKWPDHENAVFRFEVEDRGSNCPTCGYTDYKLIVTANSHEVAEMETDIASLLNEILGVTP